MYECSYTDEPPDLNVWGAARCQQLKLEPELNVLHVLRYLRCRTVVKYQVCVYSSLDEPELFQQTIGTC
jgi:predicted GNAT family N-acyltransferase